MVRWIEMNKKSKIYGYMINIFRSFTELNVIYKNQCRLAFLKAKRHWFMNYAI